MVTIDISPVAPQEPTELALALYAELDAQVRAGSGFLGSIGECAGETTIDGDFDLNAVAAAFGAEILRRHGLTK